MEEKRNKIFMTVLIILLAVGLIWVLTFIIPIVSTSTGVAKLIYNNPILNTLFCHYNRIYGSFMCNLISFANAVYAIACLRSMYKSKTSTPKRLICYWIYLAVSLGAIVLHFIAFIIMFTAALGV